MEESYATFYRKYFFQISFKPIVCRRQQKNIFKLTTKESRHAKIGSDVYYFSMWFKTSDQSEFYISTELLISGLLMCIGFIGITDFK